MIATIVILTLIIIILPILAKISGAE